MNKARRNRLEKLIGELVEVREDEQEAFDNLPESLQSGERGEAIESAIDSIEEAMDALTEAIT